MGFDFYDRSNHESRPIFLYEFSLGIRRDGGEVDFSEISYNYASLPFDYEFGGITYKAAALTEDGASFQTVTQTNQFKITLPTSSEIAQIYKTLPPKCLIQVVVRQKQLEDDEAPIYWTGFITGVSHADVQTSVDCYDLISMLSDTSDRSYWSRGCNHTLYDHNCRVDKSKYAVIGNISSISGHVLTIPEAETKADGWFSNGFLEWGRWSETAVDRLSITNHKKDKITLSGIVPFSTGDKVTLYPSCDFSKGDGGCSRFNNIDNYGGFTFMVGQSPFDGSAIATVGQMWATLLIGLGTMILSYGLQIAMTKKPQKPTASTPKDADFPQIEEGTGQLVVFGQRCTGSWQVLNYGNVTTKAIKSKGKK